MRFMMLMFPAKAIDDGTLKPDLSVHIEAMSRYNDELQKAGVLIALDGLQPSKLGARVRVVDGKKQLLDGPFTEAKEIVGGYWILQTRNREEALEWARRVPLNDDGSFVELRQIAELSDLIDLVRPQDEKLADYLATHKR